MKTKMKKIGEIAVDSGTILLIDPCYLDKFKSNEFDEDKKGNDLSYNGCSHVAHNGGGPVGGLGIATPSIDDGLHPVFGFFDKDGEIVSILIDIHSTKQIIKEAKK